MQNIAIFQRSIGDKPDWDSRDWISFLNALYADTNSDIRIKPIIDRVNYEYREPNYREKASIVEFIKNIYTESGANASYLRNLVQSNLRYEVGNLGRLLYNLSSIVVTTPPIVGEILMSDNFDDATIDVSKWITTNPVDGVDISETTTLNFIGNPASPVASSNPNNVTSVNGFNGNDLVFRVTVSRNSTAANAVKSFKVFDATATYSTGKQVSITCNGTISQFLICTVYDGATFIYNPGNTSYQWNTSPIDIRITYNLNTFLIKFQVFTGVWTTVGSYTYDLGTSLKTGFSTNSNATDTGTPTTMFDNFYVTNYEFAGNTP